MDNFSYIMLENKIILTEFNWGICMMQCLLGSILGPDLLQMSPFFTLSFVCVCVRVYVCVCVCMYVYIYIYMYVYIYICMWKVVRTSKLVCLS